MKLRGWLTAILIAFLPVALVGAGLAYMSAPSVVVITNRGNQPATLSVRTERPGQFSWDGELRPGGRVVRFARFSDNSIRTTCRDADGERIHIGGYVTNGAPQVVTIKVDGCANVSTEVDF